MPGLEWVGRVLVRFSGIVVRGWRMGREVVEVDFGRDEAGLGSVPVGGGVVGESGGVVSSIVLVCVGDGIVYVVLLF